MNSKKSSKRFLSMLLTLVMVLGLAPNMAFAAEAAPKTGTAKVTMLNETKEEPSMCDVMFDETAELTESGDNVVMKLKVAYPVPAFKDQGTDGTVKNFSVTYNGTAYTAESDITSKPNMTVKATKETFGLVKGDQIPAQVLTLTLPKAAVAEGAVLKTDAYVNVVMNADVVFRMSLSNVTWNSEEKPDPEPEGTIPAPDLSKYNTVGTIKLELGNASNIEMPDGTYKNAKALVQIPNKDSRVGITDYGVMDQLNHDELPLLEKDGKYYVPFNFQKEYPQYGNEYFMEGFNKVGVDLNNPEAVQSQTPMDYWIVKIDGIRYFQFLFELGTKDQITERSFFWMHTRTNRTEYDTPDKLYSQSYQCFSMRGLPSYIITPDQKQMVPDGEYMVNYTDSREGFTGIDYGYNMVMTNPDQKVPMSVKDGVATIRFEVQSGPKVNNPKPFTSNYMIYGVEHHNEVNQSVGIPLEETKTNYAYVKTNDLRRVILLDDGGESYDYDFHRAIRIDMDSITPADAPLEYYNILEDGLYTGQVEIIDAKGESHIYKDFPIKGKNNKVYITVPYDKATMSKPTRYEFGSANSQYVGYNATTFDLYLYHMDDTATYSFIMNDVEQKFQIKLVKGTVEEKAVDCGMKDGDYLINFKALKSTNDQESMAGNFIEQKEVPVHVENGKMFITLDIKTSDTASHMSDLITGIKHEFNGKVRKDEFTVTDPLKYNDGEERITTTIRINNLTEPTNMSIFVTAMGSWADLRLVPDTATLKDAPAADVQAAADVSAKIKAIGTVTADSEAAIKEAREAYNALTALQKKFVQNSPDLLAAEATFTALKDAKTVQDVIDKITAIGEVTLEDEAAIADARAAYDALTDAQKELVTNADALTAAEAELKELKERVTPKSFHVRFVNHNDQVVWERTVRGFGGIFAPIILDGFKPVTWTTDDVEGGMTMRCGGYISAKTLKNDFVWKEANPLITFTIAE